MQRIVLLDALTAIGWEQVRRLESPLLEMMELGIARAIEAGRIAPRPPDPLASFLYGALCETAMIVARADDQKVAHRRVVTRSAASWTAWPSTNGGFRLDKRDMGRWDACCDGPQLVNPTAAR